MMQMEVIVVVAENNILSSAYPLNLIIFLCICSHFEAVNRIITHKPPLNIHISSDYMLSSKVQFVFPLF